MPSVCHDVVSFYDPKKPQKNKQTIDIFSVYLMETGLLMVSLSWPDTCE